MINAPLARASLTNWATLATWSAHRLRRSGVQVCLVKSITRTPVSLASSLAGSSGGAGGSLAVLHSSITVCADTGAATAQRAQIATQMAKVGAINRFIGILPIGLLCPSG